MHGSEDLRPASPGATTYQVRICPAKYGFDTSSVRLVYGKARPQSHSGRDCAFVDVLGCSGGNQLLGRAQRSRLLARRAGNGAQGGKKKKAKPPVTSPSSHAPHPGLEPGTP